RGPRADRAGGRHGERGLRRAHDARGHGGDAIGPGAPSSSVTAPTSGVTALPMSIAGTLIGTTAGATSIARKVLSAQRADERSERPRPGRRRDDAWSMIEARGRSCWRRWPQVRTGMKTEDGHGRDQPQLDPAP